jgi:hypothetical protein
MAFAMGNNEALHPGQISFLRAKALMHDAQKLAHPIEQFWLAGT